MNQTKLDELIKKWEEKKYSKLPLQRPKIYDDIIKDLKSLKSEQEVDEEDYEENKNDLIYNISEKFMETDGGDMQGDLINIMKKEFKRIKIIWID